MRVKRTTIRPFLAGLLLALFALGITPKVLIHNLVANHKDTHLNLDHRKADQVNKASFHCTIENQVVESPFLGHTISAEATPPNYFTRRILTSNQDPLTSTLFLFGLRGPPSSSSFIS